MTLSIRVSRQILIGVLESIILIIKNEPNILVFVVPSNSYIMKYSLHEVKLARENMRSKSSPGRIKKKSSEI